MAADSDDAWRQRQRWVESIAGLHNGGAITEADREILFREYDRMQQAVREATEAMAPEYARRVREHGKAAADEWIHAQTHELGLENGRHLRRAMQDLSFADQLESELSDPGPR